MDASGEGSAVSRVANGDRMTVMTYDSERKRIGAVTAAALACLPLFLGGCAALRPTLPEVHLERLPDIHTVILAPPTVQVYVGYEGVGGHFDAEWTETARQNLANSIARQFRQQEGLVVSEPDHPSTQFEPQPYWPLSGEIKRHQAFQAAEAPSCGLPAGAASALTEADGILLTYAAENVRLRGQRVIGAASLAFFWPIAAPLAVVLPGYAGYLLGSHQTAIKMCLVDARTGDVLWSYVEDSYYWSGDLRDPRGADSIVADVFKKFQEALSASKARKLPSATAAQGDSSSGTANASASLPPPER